MFGKILFAMSLVPGEKPVLFNDPKQTHYEDTGWEPEMGDFYKHKFLDGALFGVVQAHDELISWEFYFDDDFLGKGMPYNIHATSLYRLNVPSEHWDEIAICGPAIAFFRVDPRETLKELFPWDDIELTQHDTSRLPPVVGRA